MTQPKPDESIELSLQRLVQKGELKVTNQDGQDRFGLTEQGLKGATHMIASMVSKHPVVLNPKTMPEDLGKLLEKHGILAIASLGCEIGRMDDKPEPIFFELRFKFMGGNKQLCGIGDT